MSVVPDVLIIILSFALFGFIHSWLASKKVKEKIKKTAGNFIAFYRLVYNLFSLAAFYLLYILVPKPDQEIYDLPYPYDIVVLIPQFAGLAGLIWSTRYFCIKEFLGINQVFRWFKKEYNENDLDEKLTFNIHGPYKYVRHPVYFFTIILLLFRPEMDLFYLIFVLCIIVYFYAGSVYEEKKLVDFFGGEYLKYREKTPAIFPVKIKNR